MSLFSWSFSKDGLIIQQVQLYYDDMLDYIYVWHFIFYVEQWNGHQTGGWHLRKLSGLGHGVKFYVIIPHRPLAKVCWDN